MVDGDDSLEPNESADASVWLDANSSIAARLCPNNTDWFEFNLGTAGTVEVKFDHGLGDVDIQLYTAGGRSIGVAQSVTDDETFDMSDLDAGLYRIRVYHYSHTGVCQPYELSTY